MEQLRSVIYEKGVDLDPLCDTAVKLDKRLASKAVDNLGRIMGAIPLATVNANFPTNCAVIKEDGKSVVIHNEEEGIVVLSMARGEREFKRMIERF